MNLVCGHYENSFSKIVNKVDRGCIKRGIKVQGGAGGMTVGFLSLAKRRELPTPIQPNPLSDHPVHGITRHDLWTAFWTITLYTGPLDHSDNVEKSEKCQYKVTIHVVPNLPLTSNQKFRFSMRSIY